MKLPMRFRILHLISQDASLSDEEIMRKLQPEYRGERQFTRSIIDLHLESMRAVGLVEVTDLALDAAGLLQQKYKITAYGRSRLSYLPESWRNTGSTTAV
jgi:DNA-binding PadR family transcriptional regulator